MPDWKEFRDILPSACLTVDSRPIYRYKSEPKPDSGLDGWDCAGRRLEIRGETGQQVQRSASATPSRASSICSPQPDQVAFLQISQITFEHMVKLLFVQLDDTFVIT